jgi:hypothetical protein
MIPNIHPLFPAKGAPLTIRMKPGEARPCR